MKTRFAVSLLIASLSVANAATLTIHVEGLRKAEGQLLIAVHGNQHDYEQQSNPAAARRLAVSNNTQQLVIPDLSPGDYVVSIIHDSNNNGKLDSNFVGMPTEGWGFSNNVGARGRPSYSEAKFNVAETGSEISIRLF